MPNEVVWYHSDEVGAPTLNNAAGSLNDVLYACLVTGFRSQTLTGINVAANVATATLAGHGYTNDMMVDVAGAAPGGLNGRKRITVTASGSFTFPTTGVADGAATGVITAKRSPLGWARVANSANKAIYARTDVAATAQVLCLDDTAAGNAGINYARVVMAEAWTAADTFTGLAPTAAMLAGGQFVGKGANSISAKKWALFGDSRLMYFFYELPGAPFSTFPGLGMACFGDIVSDRAGDAYHSILGAPSSSPGDTSSQLMAASGIAIAPSGSTFVFSRLSNQLGVAVRAAIRGPHPNNPVGVSGPSYPSPVNNGASILGQLPVAEENVSFTHPIRGVMPGLYHPLCTGLHVLHLTPLANVTGTTNKLVVVALSNGGSIGAMVIDTTGPWR